MLTQVLKTIKKYAMFKPGDNVVVGVSGGPDSIALLYSLYTLQKELELQNIIVGHLDHMFRGKEAKEDALFVQHFAEKLGLKSELTSVNIPELIKVNNLSPEDAARRVRYTFLHSLAEKYSAKIAVGHNADDQAETVLMHLLQGSGLQGLAGMEPVSGIVTRPLLYIRRKDIEYFCKSNQLSTRLDSTNKKDIYLRNKIRLRLFPELVKEYNPNIVEKLIHTSEIIRAENKFLDDYIKQKLKVLVKKESSQEIVLNLRAFSEQDVAIKRRLLREAYRKLKGSQQNLSFKHVEQVMKMVDVSQVGSQIELPAGIKVEKGYQEIFFKCFSEQNLIKDFFYALPVPGKVELLELGQTITAEIVAKGKCEDKNTSWEKYLGSGNSQKIAVDFDKIVRNNQFPEVYVRNRRPGDRFIPYGMKGTKKLKDFFIDEKIPRNKRGIIPLVTCGDNGKDIIWVTGLRLAELYKVTEETSNILFLQIKSY